MLDIIELTVLFIPLKVKNKIQGTMNLNNIMRLVLLLILTHFYSCKPDKNETMSQSDTVYKDSIFDRKFQMYGPGFTGGDGTYSVPLPDGRTVWIFGDTFIGEVTPELTRKKTNPLYIRNCFVVQDGTQMTTLHQGKPEEFNSMVIPNEVKEGFKTELDIWFWPGDGFIHNNKLNVFMSKFHQAEEGMWGFEFVESVLVEFSLPDFKEVKRTKIPSSKQSGIHFGHAIFETDDYLYIYGLKNKQAYAARTEYNDITSDWEYFDGTNWIDDITLIGPMADIDGSEQFSIVKLRDKYVYITQSGGLSRKVNSLLSDTPYGPWQNKQILFETPIPFENKDLFTYNALAHPQFTKDDELLISYNTNSMKLEDHFVNAGIYRPRFMRIPINLIFKK